MRFDYQKLKDFTKAIASSFTEGGPVAGVITFSTDAEISIKLSDHQQHNSFNDAVDNIPLMGRTTRTDKALRLAQNELFTLANGARQGIPKVLIALLDGSQTPGGENSEAIARELRNAGIQLLLVGIGPEVSSSELLRIADNDQSVVFSAPTFDYLYNGSLVDDVVQRVCPGEST